MKITKNYILILQSCLLLVFILLYINIRIGNKAIRADQVNRKVKIIGKSGFPLGTIIKISGKIVDGKKLKMKYYDGMLMLNVHCVNDTVLVKDILLENNCVTREEKFKEGDNFVCYGFETGGFSGLPDKSFDYMLPVATTGFIFRPTFFIFDQTLIINGIRKHK